RLVLAVVSISVWLRTSLCVRKWTTSVCATRAKPSIARGCRSGLSCISNASAKQHPCGSHNKFAVRGVVESSPNLCRAQEGAFLSFLGARRAVLSPGEISYLPASAFWSLPPHSAPLGPPYLTSILSGAALR